MSATQRQLMLLFALLLVAQTGLSLAKYAAELQAGDRFGGDFISFWQAAQRIRAGDLISIYDPAHWRGVLAAGKPQLLAWFVYPPFALFGLWPLGHLTYGQAVAWWSLIPLPVYAALSCLLARRSGLNQISALAVLLALTLPFLSANLLTGQTGTFIAALLLGMACCWRDRPIVAGICIGLVAVKPQMGLLIPFALAAAGQWRAFAAAAFTVLALITASLLWLGSAIWADYLAMTQLFGAFISAGYAGVRQLALGPYVSLDAAGAPASLATLVQAAISLAVAAAVTRAFWQGRQAQDDGRLDLRLALLATGILLATPYALSYDTPVLVLVIIPLLARAWRTGWDGLELAAVAALVVVPFAQATFIKAHIPFGACALTLTFCALYRRYNLASPAAAPICEAAFSSPDGDVAVPAQSARYSPIDA
jgi:alpha-1,2-mannosyltransferase